MTVWLFHTVTLTVIRPHMSVVVTLKCLHPYLILFWKTPQLSECSVRSSPHSLLWHQNNDLSLGAHLERGLSGQTRERTCVQDWQYVRQRRNVKEFSFIFQHLNTLGPFGTSLHFTPYLLHSSPKLDKLRLESELITFTLCSWPEFIRQAIIVKGHRYKAIHIAWGSPYNTRFPRNTVSGDDINFW